MIVKTDGLFAALVEIIDNVLGQAEVVSGVSLSSLHPCLQEGGERFSRKKAKERFSICCVAAVSVYFNLKL